MTKRESRYLFMKNIYRKHRNRINKGWEDMAWGNYSVSRINPITNEENIYLYNAEHTDSKIFIEKQQLL